MAVEPNPPDRLYGIADDDCDPDDIALKSFFLGPQSENADWFEDVLRGALTAYFSWRRRTYPEDGRAVSDDDFRTPEFRRRRQSMATEMQRLLGRFEEEVPKFSPRYIGHMFSETSMPAMIGHIITLLHNPNNVSGDASRVGIEVEREAIGALARMLGWDGDETSGHFTSGGTVANFEGMVRARRRMHRFLARGAVARACGDAEYSLFEAAHMGWDAWEELEQHADEEQEADYDPQASNPLAAADRLRSVFGESYRGPVVLVPAHKHYSWTKGVELMGLGAEAFWPVELDDRARMSVEHLRRRIEEARERGRPVMMVVSVAGTTELGMFDPVGDVQDLLDEYADDGIDIYHHVDAAYGGFFAACRSASRTSELGEDVRDALDGIHRANSATLDPHKLGYVPYASGTFLCADRREYFAGEIDAPYVDFDHDRDPGPQTIEGSRSAAGAVATWLTARTIGLDADGYGRILDRTVRARNKLAEALVDTGLSVRIAPGASNILAFCIADDGESLTETNARSNRLYEAFSPEQNGDFFVSRTTLRTADYGAVFDDFVDRWNGRRDSDELVLIRLCVMNPFLDSREVDVDYPGAFAEAVERAV